MGGTVTETAAVGADQVAQDRCAGGGHPFPADAVVAPGEAGQQCSGRGCRYRQQAMLCLDQAAAAGQR